GCVHAGLLSLSIRTPAIMRARNSPTASAAARRHDSEHGINTARDAPHVIRELNADHSNVLQDRGAAKSLAGGAGSRWALVLKAVTTSAIDHSGVSASSGLWLLGRHSHSPTEAGCANGNLRTRHRQVQPLPNEGRLDLVTAARQTFVQAVQRPQVFGMLTRPAQLAVKAEIRAVDRFGIVNAPLLQQ